MFLGHQVLEQRLPVGVGVMGALGGRWKDEEGTMRL